MNKVFRKELETYIKLRIGAKVIRPTNIADAVSAILDFVKTEIINDRPVSIKNFGTFSPFLVPSHLGINVASKLMQVTRPHKSVRLHPHVSFTSLVDARRATFSKGPPRRTSKGTKKSCT